MKKQGSGWKNESRRHSLARRRIRTANPHMRALGKTMNQKVEFGDWESDYDAQITATELMMNGHKVAIEYGMDEDGIELSGMARVVILGDTEGETRYIAIEIDGGHTELIDNNGDFVEFSNSQVLLDQKAGSKREFTEMVEEYLLENEINKNVEYIILEVCG